MGLLNPATLGTLDIGTYTLVLRWTDEHWNFETKLEKNCRNNLTQQNLTNEAMQNFLFAYYQELLY